MFIFTFKLLSFAKAFKAITVCNINVIPCQGGVRRGEEEPCEGSRHLGLRLPGSEGRGRAAAFPLPAACVCSQIKHTYTRTRFLHNQTSLRADEVFFNRSIYLKKSPNESSRRFNGRGPSGAGTNTLPKCEQSVCGQQDRGGRRPGSVTTAHHTPHRSSPQRRKGTTRNCQKFPPRIRLGG